MKACEISFLLGERRLLVLLVWTKQLKKMKQSYPGGKGIFSPFPMMMHPCWYQAAMVLPCKCYTSCEPLPTLTVQCMQHSKLLAKQHESPQNKQILLKKYINEEIISMKKIQKVKLRADKNSSQRMDFLRHVEGQTLQKKPASNFTTVTDFSETVLWWKAAVKLGY